MNKIYNEIETELKRAKELHPDFPESIVRMVAIMAEEAGEAIREANRIEDDGNGDVEALRTELVQTAAMCVRCLEQVEARGEGLSNEKFTPGDWEVEKPVNDDELHFNDGYNYRIWGGPKKHRHGFALVLCNGRPGDTTYPQHYFEEAKANAALIAAAPEMYRVLKQLVDLTDYAELVGVIHDAKAVLKKASGEG